MAKARIGHDEEARVLESLGVDMIDESEVLTPADPFYHIAKNDFTIPFVCGCTSLGEAVRRIAEGAAMIRTKGEAGTGNVVRQSSMLDCLRQKLRPPVMLTQIQEQILSRRFSEDTGGWKKTPRLVRKWGRLRSVKLNP
ncbi:MAG: hypothetical protein Ct9H90mP26_1530 [Methanobacteriota archaeon]|nr:MAG: hypothetical protein Ct9H90mP26_1530 [Euryarchaeota archaeon]